MLRIETTTPAQTTTTMNNTPTKWEIEYAKFMRFPDTTVSSESSLLRPISSGVKRRLQGTWVPCSSPNVALDIVVDNSSLSNHTLAVSLDSVTYEEHYIAKLNFIWPQGHGLEGNSVRGSRVVLACYRDTMDQLQKFVMRFPSSEDSKKFMEVLKCLKDGSKANFSTPMLSNTHSEWFEREQAPIRHPPSQQAALALRHAPENTDVTLPENFPAVLADGFAITDSGVPKPPADIDLKGFLSAGSKKDKPFLDMLRKIDSIIVGLGGDLRFCVADA